MYTVRINIFLQYELLYSWKFLEIKIEIPFARTLVKTSISLTNGDAFSPMCFITKGTTISWVV